MKLVKIKLRCVLYMEKNKKTQDEKSPIYVCVVYKGSKKLITTGIRLLPKLWDQSRQKVKGNDAFAEKNNKILFAELLKIQENADEVVRSHFGHKLYRVYQNHLNQSAQLKTGGTDESK